MCSLALDLGDVELGVIVVSALALHSLLRRITVIAATALIELVSTASAVLSNRGVLLLRGSSGVVWLLTTSLAVLIDLLRLVNGAQAAVLRLG